MLADSRAKIQVSKLRGLRAFFDAADRDNCIRHGQEPVTRWTATSSPVASTTAAAWSRAFALPRKAVVVKTCSLPDCENKGDRRGLCNLHYEQWRLGRREIAWLDRSIIQHRDKRPFDIRFWARVDKTEDCWLWKKSVEGSGYGQLSKDGTLVRAHRVAWELTNGPIPDGLEVCHHCDTPRCVNPDHLYLGTHWQNMQDMRVRRRHVGHRLPGELAPPAKLTWEQVERIRSDYHEGNTSYRLLGIKFGVHTGTIGQIVRGQTWRPEDRP